MKKLTVDEFKKLISENDETIFTFHKKDGSIRIAKGTIKPEIISESGYSFSGTTKKKNENIVSFYDIENEDWRSFNICYDNAVINVYEKDEPIDVPEEKKVGFYEKHSDDELRELLNIGIVEFSFRKKDGSERKAKGTTNSKYLKDNDIIFDSDKKQIGVVTFFDTEIKEWRCCKEGSVLEITMLNKGI